MDYMKPYQPCSLSVIRLWHFEFLNPTLPKEEGGGGSDGPPKLEIQISHKRLMPSKTFGDNIDEFVAVILQK